MDIFVFGSNLAGKHYGGSAREAYLNHNAVMGNGIGAQGKSYAIPTLDDNFKKLSLDDVRMYVDDFIKYATNHPDDTFNVVAIGCGIAGFNESDISPLFLACPKNCNLPQNWRMSI